MGDSKFFTTTKRGEIPELRQELLSSNKKDQAAALKKIIANMTHGNDMSQLFPDVLQFMSASLDMKKMAYLFVLTYAKLKPELALLTVNSFLKDAEDINPLIRGLALRTMSSINVDKINQALSEHLSRALKDGDAYVRRTAALCVSKLYERDPALVQEHGFLDTLLDMITDPNPTVVANVLASLIEINARSETDLRLPLTFAVVRNLLTSLNDCNEWAQTYILEALMLYTPADSSEAETMAQLVGPRLAHASSSVVLSSIKLLMHVMPFFSSEDVKRQYCRKMTPPLVTLLHSDMPEIKYVGLRNVLLLIQKRPDILENELKVFFCEYNDPIYVKMAKLEVMMRIVNDRNVEQVLAELKEYAAEVDVDFVRKAVRAIGMCAVKIERAAERCIETLLELIQTKVNYVVQEAIVVIRDIFRKYPNRYESIIATLCENLDTLDEPEAKASMIWIIGHYSDRIDNAAELLEIFFGSFHEEPVSVQLSLLTATVKLFLRRPNESESLIKRIFKWCTEEVNNPDLRDRAFMYWRLVSSDPIAAKSIVLADRPLGSTGTYDSMEPSLLNELIEHVGSLASVYHKPPSAFLGTVKARTNTDTVDVVARGGNTDGQAGALGTENAVAAAAGNSYLSSAADSMYGAPTGVSLAGVVGTTGIAMDLLDLDEPTPEPSASDLGDGIAGLSFGSPASGSGYGIASPTTATGVPVGGMSDIFMNEQRLVLPKQTLLTAANGKGLEVNGTFARRNGAVFLDLVFSNRAMQAMTDFAIQINTNSFGLTPAAPLDIRAPLMPNQSIETSLQLLLTGQIVPRSPPDNLQIALKNNVSVFYFQTAVPLHVLFSEEPAIERSDYLRIWRELPDSIEDRCEVDGVRFATVAALKNKLQINNVFTVAEREVDDVVMLYCQARCLPSRTVFLVEVRVNLAAQSCTSSVRSEAVHLVKPFQAAVAAILRHGN